MDFLMAKWMDSQMDSAREIHLHSVIPKVRGLGLGSDCQEADLGLGLTMDSNSLMERLMD